MEPTSEAPKTPMSEENARKLYEWTQKHPEERFSNKPSIDPKAAKEDWATMGEWTKRSPQERLKEQRIADGRERFSRWEERLYLVLGTPEHFGRVAQQKQEQFDKRVQETRVGISEKAGEIKDAATGKVEAWKTRLVDLKDSTTKRVKDAMEAASVARDNAVEAFFDRVDSVKKSANERKDKIVAKANAIGTASAKAVARGAEAVANGVEVGIGVGVAGAVGAYNLTEKAVKWTLRETFSLPHDLRADALRGIKGVKRELARMLNESAYKDESSMRSHRAKATAIRARWS